MSAMLLFLSIGLCLATLGYLVFSVVSLRTQVAKQQQKRARWGERERERDRLFELSLDMMCATGFDGHVVVANPRFEQVLGWTESELRAAHFIELVHPDDREATTAELERSQQGRPTTAFQNRVLCKDGTYKLLSWRAMPDREHGVIYCIARDVTDDDQLFRTFVEHIDDVVWMEDTTTGQVLYVSPAFERIWGRPCSSLQEDPRAWLDAIHPDDRDRVRAALAEEYDVGTFSEAYRIVRPDGSIRWISDQGYPVRNEKGEITRLVGIAKDVTERRAAEERLRHTERLASVGTLAAGIAHEINSPLGAILVSTAAALREDGNPAHTARILDNVLNEARRCGEIVKSVLRFAREETLEKRSGELNASVRQAIALFDSYAKERGTIIQSSFAEDLPAVALNQTAIQQVLLNLLKNACDADAQQVTVCTEHSRDGVRLTVEDDGVGMSETDRDHVFEPFYTTHREQGGSGLGLSLTHAIIADHDGTLRIETPVEGGTKMILEFPEMSSST